MKIAITILALLLCVPLTIWNGYALSILWGWFVVPLGLPQVSIAHAIGIAAVLKMMLPSPESNPDENWIITVLSSLAASCLKPAIFLAFGWVLLGYM